MKIKGKESGLFQFDLFLLITIQVQISGGLDTVFPGQSLSGNGTIISKGGVFEMGFFSPVNSNKYYIGVWYKGLPMPEKTVVWVANRELPVSDPTSASLEFGEDGNLVLLSPFGQTIWSTNLTSGTPLPNATIGVLGDNGNFFLRERFNASSILWQSFDYPTDTLLPGAQFVYEKTVLTSWKNTDDPALGTFIADNYNYFGDPVEVRVQQRNGSGNFWNQYLLDNNSYIEVDHWLQYMWFSVSHQYQSGLFRYVLEVNGQLKLFGWWKGMQHWKSILYIPQYSYYPCSCAEFTICDMKNPPLCHCIEGFVPTSQHDWNLGIYQCKRRTDLHCFNRTKDKFSVMPNIRYPLRPELLQVKNTGTFISSGDRWRFLCRLAASEMEDSGNKSHTRIVVVVVSSPISLFGIGIIVMLIIMWRKLRGRVGSLEAMGDTLMHFKLRHLQKATKNFTLKLGEGGFSVVYKGEFPNSTFVAVKQLKGQMHGDKQLRVEISTIGTIQHRNLARLRGFCLEHSKRFLVYDYMPNGSLEFHLFKESNGILDWARRYNIALGTAKGLAYLHESCRDCIIHCDIKPENILLDANFDPKVADFGLAKLLGRNFSHVLTTMRGTRGYLAPEWFSGEAITAKVDVYSYGQVLFEIISGRRNMDLSNDELSNYFPVLVLTALNNGAEVVTLVDPKLEGEVNVEELTRACKVACWCIQDHGKDRPTMAQVIQILEGVHHVGVPPIPQFFQSIVGGSIKSSDVKESEFYTTSSSLPQSFSFQSPVQSIHHII